MSHGSKLAQFSQYVAIFNGFNMFYQVHDVLQCLPFCTLLNYFVLSTTFQKFWVLFDNFHQFANQVMRQSHQAKLFPMQAVSVKHFELSFQRPLRLVFKVHVGYRCQTSFRRHFIFSSVLIGVLTPFNLGVPPTRVTTSRGCNSLTHQGHTSLGLPEIERIESAHHCLVTSALPRTVVPASPMCRNCCRSWFCPSLEQKSHSSFLILVAYDHDLPI